MSLSGAPVELQNTRPGIKSQSCPKFDVTGLNQLVPMSGVCTESLSPAVPAKLSSNVVLAPKRSVSTPIRDCIPPVIDPGEPMRDISRTYSGIPGFSTRLVIG